MSKIALCPRCKTEMRYVTEVGRSDGSKQVFRYYYCPACSLRLLDESFRVTIDGEAVVIRFSQGSRRPIVVGR